MSLLCFYWKANTITSNYALMLFLGAQTNNHFVGALHVPLITLMLQHRCWGSIVEWGNLITCKKASLVICRWG